MSQQRHHAIPVAAAVAANRTHLRAIVDLHTVLANADTPREHQALVFLNTTRGATTCRIPLFADLRRSVRSLLRSLHTQTEYAHQGPLDADPACGCRARVASASCFFVDSATRNPLLPITPQPVHQLDIELCIGRAPLIATADGARAVAASDPLLDAPLQRLVDQGYLTAQRLGGSGDKGGASYDAALREARQTAHAPPPMCPRQLAAFVPPMLCSLKCNTRQPSCRCAVCDCGRLRDLLSRNTPPCPGSAHCWCLFVAALGRASLVLTLDTVPALGDLEPTSPLLALDSPTVVRYLAARDARHPGSGAALAHSLTAMRLHQQRQQQQLDVRINAPPPEPARRVAFAHLDFDAARELVRARLDLSTAPDCVRHADTLSALIAASGRWRERAVLEEAGGWLTEPARHYLGVGLSGFAEYMNRFEATFSVNGGKLFDEQCERALYAELTREPDCAVAINRLLAFEPTLQPASRSGDSSYTSGDHDDRVCVLIGVLHIIALVEHCVKLDRQAAAELAVAARLQTESPDRQRRVSIVAGTPPPLLPTAREDPLLRFAELVRFACARYNDAEQSPPALDSYHPIKQCG